MGIFESGTSSDVKQTTTVNPWEPQGTALTYGFQLGKNNLDQAIKQGPSPYSQTGTDALNQMRMISRGNNPLLDPAVNAVAGLSQTGGISTQPMFGNIYGQTQGEGQGYLNQGFFGDVAQGKMLGYPGAGGDNFGQLGAQTAGGGQGGAPGFVGSNPYRQAALDDALRRTTDNLKSSFSAKGRYGSDDMMERGADELGGIASQFNLQAYNSDQDRAMQAAQAVSQEGLARQGVALNAAQGYTGAQQANASNRLQAASMAPQMNELRYADAQKMAGVGAAFDDRTRASRDYADNELRNYMSLLGSVPGGAGVQSTSGPGASNWLGLMSGAAAGAGAGSMFGPVGTAVGAGLGGLGNLLFG